jgi:hypothetical protein
MLMLSFGVPALASALPEGDPSEATSLSPARSHIPTPKRPGEASDEASEATKDTDEIDADEPKTAKPGRAQRNGPPSWAHAHGDKSRRTLTAWTQLTPQQRAKKMAGLTRAHSTDMKKWSTCTAAGRTDCVRPLPPGLAKRS